MNLYSLSLHLYFYVYLIFDIYFFHDTTYLHILKTGTFLLLHLNYVDCFFINIYHDNKKSSKCFKDLCTWYGNNLCFDRYVLIIKYCTLSRFTYFTVNPEAQEHYIPLYYSLLPLYLFPTCI